MGAAADGGRFIEARCATSAAEGTVMNPRCGRSRSGERLSTEIRRADRVGLVHDGRATRLVAPDGHRETERLIPITMVATTTARVSVLSRKSNCATSWSGAQATHWLRELQTASR
jgi:hypothetical protein